MAIKRNHTSCYGKDQVLLNHLMLTLQVTIIFILNDIWVYRFIRSSLQCLGFLNVLTWPCSTLAAHNTSH